jgi:tRNA-Thr(GGU) m(6)t(6)A37 methyltransferase TsaA
VSGAVNSILYRPIGIIHSSFKESKGTPIQPVASLNSSATVEVFDEFAAGLMDIEGFSHLILIFHMHLIKKPLLKVIPFLDTEAHGVFATRSPGRPNPIGFSVVELEKSSGNMLYVKGVDIIDGTPLLDIKPFVPAFDVRVANKIGWFEKVNTEISVVKDDGRFC